MIEKEIKVALVDDHELLRSGLAGIINRFEGYHVIFEAGNGEEFIEQLSSNQGPDIILLDISMPKMDGYQTAAWIKEHLPASRILVLSMLDHEAAVIRMIHAGARGYILKDCKPAMLKQAFDSISTLGYYSNDLITSRHIRLITEGREEELGMIHISDREKEFLKLACSDFNYKEIAEKMGVSPRTIDNYRDALFEKFDIKSRVGLALVAIKSGLYSV